MFVRNLLLAVLVGVVGVSQAEVSEQQNISQQQLSKRPYAKAPTVEKDNTYEGDAAAYKEETAKDKNYKTLQLHMLGKRPYAE